MKKPEYLTNLVERLKSIPDDPRYYKENERLIREGAVQVGWILSEPVPPQWDYWHCIEPSGGLIPFYLSDLIEKLSRQVECDRPSEGKTGGKHNG